MSMGFLEAIIDARTRLGPCDVELRPYQTEAIDAIRTRFVEGDKSTLLILPTGCGKTVTFGMIARRMVEKQRKVLILAHRAELIDQAVSKLDTLGVEAAVEMGERRARSIIEPDVVVATVQTMQRKRLELWKRDHFDLIITDEAHHATAATYQRIYKHFGGTRHLGVTATADRADDDNLGGVFESVAYELSLWDAMTAPDPGPYLSRLKFCQCDVDIDLRDIRTTGGDFNMGDVEARIKPLIETLANSVKQEIGNRRTLIFTPDVGSAQAMASALESLGLKFTWTSGDDSLRADKIKALQKGDIQGLVNCALLTEGFDCPAISAVVLCRPTKSRSLYAQMVGRGTRLAPNKSDCLIVDFNYLTSKHDLVKPVDLFDTSNTNPEVLALANKKTEKAKGVDLLKAIEDAQAEHRQREALKIKAREREIRYRKRAYDPLDYFQAMEIPVRGRLAMDVTPATQAQKIALGNMTKGRLNVDALTKTQASTLMGTLIPRMNAGLASEPQVHFLISLGMDAREARGLTRGEASEAINRLKGTR
ncbi:SSL2 DNA or RNA helicases of superfamily II [uncultured Caudovirales phage]|uniref:SSL2 DNA or RNA helicases of superfamily II n=1 Tax=uncultured Caudovirales phage TaxID=2100421 RepID=A0A6J5LDN7_9CAUD|nr:SSL2 DNA or RNA helicases of superfamily II [uncultured Caudovirales phage]